MANSMVKLSDSDILRSWHSNADAWAQAIENQEIESRRLATNQAITDAVVHLSPKTLLDVGCGEGWLSQLLIQKGIDVMGIDAVSALVERARVAGKGRFETCTYEAMASYDFGQKFDCLLCNFSLIGKESTEAVIQAAGRLLAPSGTLLIQTLHPLIACGDLPYEEGWRAGSWAGFSSEFKDPPPWYFRTIEAWSRLFKENGFVQLGIREPMHPKTLKPASIIFECRR